MNRYLIFIIILTNIANAAEKSLPEMPSWQKSIVDKINFDVKVLTKNQLLGANGEEVSDSIFLVFTAEATEELERRLLSVNIEVLLSDGRTKRFDNISFFLVNKGVECDVRKVHGPGGDFRLPGFNNKEEGEKPKTPKVIQLRILKLNF